MTPWVDEWEKQFLQQPSALAVVNDRGQKYTYGDLRSRAKDIEHRYDLLGLKPGDRLLVNWTRHQSLDDVVVTLWACGLRGACMAPYWCDFPKAQLKRWKLIEDYAPRLRADVTLGEECIFAVPTPPVHNMALAWPERDLDGAGRTVSKIRWRWITHEQLDRSISRLKSIMGIRPGDRVAWMDPGLGSLGWLSVFCALGSGASLHQVPILSRRTASLFDAWLDLSPCDWMVPSSDWCASAGIPHNRPQKGIISAWGQAMPYIRKLWGQGSRWIDVWAPASCGWWWGYQEWNGSEDEPFLPDHHECPDWDFENGLLHAFDTSIAHAVQDKQGAHTGIHLALSNLSDYDARQAWHRAILNVRLHPRVGDITSLEIDGKHWIGIVPRCSSENPQDILDDVKERLLSCVDKKHRGHPRLVVTDVSCPRDEIGFFDVSAIRTDVMRS